MTPGACVGWIALSLLLTAPAHAQELELRWSRVRAFVHEQVQLEALVVHSVGLNPRWEAPPFDGFVSERLPSDGSGMRRDAAGQYVRTTRFRHALFPTRSGVIEVPASRILLLDANGRETSLSVPATRIAVESLPELGRPRGFDAAVGTLSVRAMLAPHAIALGEHANLEIDVFGTANVWDVAPPELSTLLGVACEIFSEPPQLDRTVREDEFFARKTFRFSLVPSREGRLRIPPFEFAHFNPEQAAYRVASSDPLELEVGPARAPAAQESARVPADPAPSLGWLAWLPTAFIVASGLCLAVAFRRRPRPAHPPALPASTRAPALATVSPQELLRHAEASLEEASFGALLGRALRAYCAAGDASLTTSELAARIPDPELVALLRAIDAERFSGRASLEQRRTLLNTAVAYVRAREPRTIG